MKPSALHHGSLCVTEIERSTEFYVEALGLEVDESRPDFPFPGVLQLEQAPGQKWVQDPDGNIIELTSA